MTYTDVAFAPIVGQEAPAEEGNEETTAAAPVAQEETPAGDEPAEAPSAPEEAGNEEGEETPSQA